jgi:hypothetical protein
MMFMHFSLQIILLATGFGGGYGLLLLAKKQEDNLKTVGKSLGWILIVMSIFLSLISSIASMQACPKQHNECPVTVHCDD